MWNFQLPQWWENTFPLHKPSSLWYLVMEPRLTNTLGDHKIQTLLWPLILPASSVFTSTNTLSKLRENSVPNSWFSSHIHLSTAIHEISPIGRQLVQPPGDNTCKQKIREETTTLFVKTSHRSPYPIASLNVLLLPHLPAKTPKLNW